MPDGRFRPVRRFVGGITRPTGSLGSMNAPAAEHRNTSLRVGDAERQQCITELLDHHLDGRLDSEEYDRRERQALSAVTVEQLMVLTEDLPAEQRVARPRLRASRPTLHRTRGITSPGVSARKDVRRLWPVAVLWGGSFVAQGGSTADWWHINDDITSGFLMASFGFATHWVSAKFKD